MQANLTDWLAGGREHRLAMIIALAGSLTLVLLLVAPSWFLPEQTPVNNKDIRTRVLSHKLPSRPTQVRPATKSKTGSKHSLAHGYYIQAGAFRHATRAKKIADLLRRADWHVQTAIKKNLHAVLIGPWATRSNARNAKRRLASKNKINAFIVQM